MKSSFITAFSKKIQGATLVLSLLAFASCQPSETGQQIDAEVVSADTMAVSTDTIARRPAPDFFVIPEEMVRTRVWICEDGFSDIFHLKHDCPVLIQCKGKGSFRNLLLTRAIEDYGRYNCQECSKNLDIIFDEEAVREMGR